MSAPPPPYSGPDPGMPSMPPAYNPASGPEYNEKQMPPPAGYSNPPPPPGYGPQAYPPQAYPQQGQFGNQTTIVTQPAVITTLVQHFGEAPVHISCPHCRAEVLTSTHYEVGRFAWIVALIICLTGCWLLCCIPFCISSCQDVVHSCPNCKQVISIYNRGL